MSSSSGDRRAVVLLALGTIAGIGLAALSIVSSGGGAGALPDDAMALVNGQPISRDAFAEFVGALATERKTVDLDAETRRQVLARMVDEELLLQRGIELGLPRYERTARRAIVAAVVAAVTAEAEAAEPSEDELRAFHGEHADRFTRPGRLRLDTAFVAAGARPEATAWQQANELARRARAGESFASLAAELGDPSPLLSPTEPISLDEVRERLGPSAAIEAEGLAVGQVGDPVRGAAGYFVLALRERSPGEPLLFDDVRAHVRLEYLRGVGERALGRYLEDLRAGAEVRVRDPDTGEGRS